MQAYPKSLPLAQLSNKNMRGDTSFQVSIPLVGIPIFQRLTDDIRHTLNLQFVFNKQEDLIFQLWLRHRLKNGSEWFEIPINIGGSGLQTQVAHFTSMPIQKTITGSIITWEGQIIVKELYDSNDANHEIIFDFDIRFASGLDKIVNQISRAV